jgi:hypothetical protein
MEQYQKDRAFDRFFSSYKQCAMWAENDNETPLDQTSHVLAPETLTKMEADCKAFFNQNLDLIENDGGRWGDAGHDFWLTRNGHGCGFWDGDWPASLGDLLTEKCKAFGACELYVADGKIYTCS